MRLVLILILLTTIICNDLLLDFCNENAINLEMYELGKESSSEKESQDTSENEIKKDYIGDNFQFLLNASNELECNNFLNINSYSPIYKELFSPPPELT